MALSTKTRRVIVYLSERDGVLHELLATVPHAGLELKRLARLALGQGEGAEKAPPSARPPPRLAVVETVKGPARPVPAMPGAIGAAEPPMLDAIDARLDSFVF